MKKIIYIIALAAITLLNSCQIVDVLDKKPPYQADLEGAITNARTAELALIGVYSYLPQGSYSNWYDQVGYAFRSGLMSRPTWFTGNSNMIYFVEKNWPVLSSNSDTEWTQSYNIIKNANLLLTRLNDIGDFAGERRETMKGELYYLKAFAYHRLLVRYGEHWDLNSKYGLVVREDLPSIGGDKKSRASVKDSYTLILDNLNDAILMAPKYSDSGYSSSLAAKAIKVKVLFDMGNYEDCVKLADEVIAEAPIVDRYEDIFNNALTSKEVLFCRKFGDSEISNLSSRISAIDDGKWGPTQAFIKLFENGDLRKNVVVGDSVQIKHNGVFSDLYRNATVKKLNNTSNNMPIIFLRSAEMYLIKAEAIMLNGGSIADSWAPIVPLRVRAGVSTVAPTSMEDLKDEICNEWLRELGCENSSEWMAIRRVGIEKLLEMNYLLQESYDKAADKDVKRREIGYKRILAIPSDEINSNPVDQNPGY